MPDLKSAITIVEVIAATGAAMVLGDYLGHKVGRWKLAAIIGGIVLVSIIVFTIYAAVVLPSQGG